MKSNKLKSFFITIIFTLIFGKLVIMTVDDKMAEDKLSLSFVLAYGVFMIYMVYQFVNSLLEEKEKNL